MSNNHAEELSQPPYQNQLETIFTETDLQLVGSIGRHMIVSTYQPTSFPICRPNGELRDIDALYHTGVDTAVNVPINAVRPLSLDLTSCNWLKVEANGIWLTSPFDQSLAESIRPEIFEPVIRNVGALTCRTYSAATQQRLNRLPVFERPKDKLAFQKYDTFIDSLTNSPDVRATDVPLPAQFYEPFVKFDQALRQKHKKYFLACHIGVAVNTMPAPMRNALKSVGRPIKHRYLGTVPYIEPTLQPSPQFQE